MIFVVLWTAIFAFVAAYLLRSPKVRSWLKILLRAKILKRIIILPLFLVAAIIVAYKLHPTPETKTIDQRSVFVDYSARAILKLESTGSMSIDSSCHLDRPEPELAYILPLVLNTYTKIVEKPTKPVLVRLNDTLQMELRGYKQFKNRGIKLRKLLQKRLGNRYSVLIQSGESTTHILQVAYTSTPWDKERLMALPVMEAAREYKIDPALLMSLIRHVSDFDFNFRGPRDTQGLLAMGGYNKSDNDGGQNTEDLKDLNQVFAGAKRLSKQLQVLSKENAIATFYPERGMDYPDANWTKSPLIKSWVNQVLADVEFYRSNGL